AQEIIERVFAQRLDELPAADELRDPKTRLQEWLQARGMGLPEYELVDVSGKAHKQTFEVSCRVGQMPSLTHGRSTTRRKAEQKAAADMLAKLVENQA
ncbi:MAG: putative dsRNA-binding protein, partial [Woeseiaceae bacterium]